MEKTMKKISLFITLFFMALSILFFFIARRYPPGAGGTTGPGFFPMILSGIVFLLAVLLLLKIRKESGEPVHLFSKKNATVFLSLLITVLYVVLMSVVGFPIATLLYLFGLMMFFQVKSWKILIGVPFLTTAILYGVFTRFLSVQFPRGILF
jgi:putative tricarboxylic transport membrane protein